MAYKFNRRAMLERARLSEMEVAKLGLEPVNVLCPHCKHIVLTVYPDVRGHMTVKCKKCKQVSVINLYLEQLKGEQRV